MRFIVWSQYTRYFSLEGQYVRYVSLGSISVTSSLLKVCIQVHVTSSLLKVSIRVHVTSPLLKVYMLLPLS
jgi:uncharacterized membrane protein